jgi:uncharacterized membrane protein
MLLFFGWLVVPIFLLVLLLLLIILVLLLTLLFFTVSGFESHSSGEVRAGSLNDDNI